MDPRIEQYVESVYDGLELTKEVAELKEEMRSHLGQTVKDLLSQGYSVDESVRLAILRFGDPESLRNGLDSLYGNATDPGRTRRDSVLSWVSLVLGIVSVLTSVYFIISLPLGLIGLILGTASRNTGSRKMANLGIAVSLVAILLSIVLLLFGLAEHSVVTPIQIHSSSQPIPSSQS